MLDGLPSWLGVITMSDPKNDIQLYYKNVMADVVGAKDGLSRNDLDGLADEVARIVRKVEAEREDVLEAMQDAKDAKAMAKDSSQQAAQADAAAQRAESAADRAERSADAAAASAGKAEDMANKAEAIFNKQMKK